MDYEFVFWMVCGVICALFFISTPFIKNWISYKEVEEMFLKRDKKYFENVD